MPKSSVKRFVLPNAHRDELLPDQYNENTQVCYFVPGPDQMAVLTRNHSQKPWGFVNMVSRLEAGAQDQLYTVSFSSYTAEEAIIKAVEEGNEVLSFCTVEDMLMHYCDQLRS